MMIRIINNTYCLFRKAFSKLYYNISDSFYIRNAPKQHKLALSKIKGKTRLKCVFLVLSESGWKYDYVFRKMLKSKRFDPIIVICPRTGWGNDYTKRKMDEATTFFVETKKYPTIVAFDEKKQCYLDLRKDINPDIIFYCAPYRSTIYKDYFITRYSDILTVYVSYAFNSSSDYKGFHDELLQNLVWRYYIETETHKQYSVSYARNKGRNIVVTGYPGIEAFLDQSYKPSYRDWKINNPNLKRIIWAPHHTIADTGTVIYSCFLMYCDFMVEMAKKYADTVQFVFKPHPLLRPKLERLWGKKNTDAYFQKWVDMPNTSYSEGNYVDLFLTSDAMIHDSGSFIAEYLYLNKPVMRTMNDYSTEEMYNGFTQRCIDVHYKAFSSEDIDDFITNVVNGIDPMLELRKRFIDDEMMPNGLPSDNMINDLLESIDNQILYRN